MFCGIDIIPQNIPHIQSIHEEYSMKYCQSYKNIVIIMNNGIQTLIKHCFIHPCDT